MKFDISLEDFKIDPALDITNSSFVYTLIIFII